MTPSYVAVLDPAAAIANRTELPLNSGGINIDREGIDWGDIALQSYMSEQRWGSQPIGYRIPNRVITIPLAVGMSTKTPAEGEEARKKLQNKVALLQREGGVIKRERSGGKPLYADVVSAVLTMPDRYGESGIEDKIILKLECLPDFYGEEIELDEIKGAEGTGQVVAVLKKATAQALIEGDYPARCRIVVKDGSGAIQKGLIWGLRSRHYDSASTAALYQDCSAMTPLNGAVSGAEASAFSGKAMKLASPTTNAWHPFISTDVLTGTKPLTQIGTYRVWLRVKGANGQQVRLAWSLDDATAPTSNTAVTLGVHASEYQLVDLGEIRIEEPPVGEHWWRGFIEVNTGNASSEVIADRVWLQPLDETAGKLRATVSVPSFLLEDEGLATTTSQTETEAGAIAWVSETQYWINSMGVECGPGATSKFLFCTGFGNTVPAGAEIKGIEVVGFSSLLGFTGVGGNPANNKINATVAVGLLKAGAAAGTLKTVKALGSGAPWNTGAFGGPTDLWGTTWTQAQVNASNFGFRVRFQNTGLGGNETLYVQMRMRIYYSVGASSVQEDAVIYGSRESTVRFDGAYRQDISSNTYVGISEQLGDLPRLPSSGLEGRAVELFVKNSRGDLQELADPNIDAMTVKVFYRPCFVGRV